MVYLHIVDDDDDDDDDDDEDDDLCTHAIFITLCPRCIT